MATTATTQHASFAFSSLSPARLKGSMRGAVVCGTFGAISMFEVVSFGATATQVLLTVLGMATLTAIAWPVMRLRSFRSAGYSAADRERLAAMPGNLARDASTDSNSSRSFDLWTIAAIAICAAVITDVIHEGLGHGGMCVASHGWPIALSTVHFECSADTRLVAAGGTLANLIFGIVSFGAARVIKQSAHWRYFFWLLMTFNLLDAAGYFLFSGIGNFGDWAEVVAGWHPLWAWRVGLVVLGTVTYFLLFVPLCLRELRPFLGKDSKIRVRRARLLTLTPYLIGGIIACAAGVLNPVGPLLILLSAAAASFGGHSGLAWMWTLLYGPHMLSSELRVPPIGRNWGWMFAAAVLAIVFIAGLGPGVKFDPLRR